LTSGKPCQRQEQYTVAKAYLDGYGVTKTIQNLSCGCVVLPTLVIHQHNIFSVICIDGDSALPLITAKQKNGTSVQLNKVILLHNILSV